MQAGEDMNVPLVVTSVDFHAGDLPSVASLVSVTPQNVRLAALKRAEDGQGIVLRMVEVEGKAIEAQVAVAAGLLGDAGSAEVDTLERPVNGNCVRLEGETLTVCVPAFGVTTVKVG